MARLSPSEVRQRICNMAVRMVEDLYDGRLEIPESVKQSPQYLAPIQAKLGELMKATLPLGATVGWININGSENGYWVSHMLVDVTLFDRQIATVGLHQIGDHDGQGETPGKITMDWVNYRVDSSDSKSPWGLISFPGDYTW